MTNYSIELSKKAAKKLDKLPNHVAAPIISAIGELASNPRPPHCKKLKGRDGYRIRQGKYRIIYEIVDNELIVHVLTLGHRKDIYD